MHEALFVYLSLTRLKKIKTNGKKSFREKQKQINPRLKFFFGPEKGLSLSLLFSSLRSVSPHSTKRVKNKKWVALSEVAGKFALSLSLSL